MAASVYSGNRRAGGRAGARYRPMSDINVTPLVDVMLVLLVVFMVTAPLLTVGVPVDLPQTQAPPINEPQGAARHHRQPRGHHFYPGDQRADRLAGPAAAIDHRQQSRRRALCAWRQGHQLRSDPRSDEPGQLRRLPQGVAGRRGAKSNAAARPAATGAVKR